MRRGVAPRSWPVARTTGEDLDTDALKDQAILDRLQDMDNAADGKKIDECQELIRSICMKEIHWENAKCCWCGNKTLVLQGQGNGANPWATIKCHHEYAPDVPCGFQHTCGHSEPPNPSLRPKPIKKTII